MRAPGYSIPHLWRTIGKLLISIMIMPLCQLLLLFLPLVTYAQNLVNNTSINLSDTTKITLEKCLSTLPQFWFFLSFRRSGSGWTDNNVNKLISNVGSGTCAYFYTQQIGDSVTFKFTGACYLWLFFFSKCDLWPPLHRNRYIYSGKRYSLGSFEWTCNGGWVPDTCYKRSGFRKLLRRHPVGKVKPYQYRTHRRRNVYEGLVWSASFSPGWDVVRWLCTRI